VRSWLAGPVRLPADNSPFAEFRRVTRATGSFEAVKGRLALGTLDVDVKSGR